MPPTPPSLHRLNLLHHKIVERHPVAAKADAAAAVGGEVVGAAEVPGLAHERSGVGDEDIADFDLADRAGDFGRCRDIHVTLFQGRPVAVRPRDGVSSFDP